MKNVLKKAVFFFQPQHSPRFPEPSVTGNLCFSCSRKKISFTNPSCLPTAPCFYHLLLLLPLQPRTSSKCYKQSAFGLNTHKVLRRNSMKHTRRRICHWSKKLPSKATTPKVTPQHILQNDRLLKMSFSLSRESTHKQCVLVISSHSISATLWKSLFSWCISGVVHQQPDPWEHLSTLSAILSNWAVRWSQKYFRIRWKMPEGIGGAWSSEDCIF